MPVLLQAITTQTPRPHEVAAFWAGLLGRTVVEEADGALVPGSATQVGLRFVAGTEELPHRLHLHLTSDTVDEQRRILDEVLRWGGRRRGSEDLPFGRDLYLADPDGTGFCLIEPGNGYLAGCGPLGEATCDGTRASGLFWQRALDWDLVWDEGDQTAIQAPGGGTKIAWDVSHETPLRGPTRQSFDLVAAGPEAEADRLAALGAGRRGERSGVVLMTDPDGMDFTLRAGHEPVPLAASVSAAT